MKYAITAFLAVYLSILSCTTQKREISTNVGILITKLVKKDSTCCFNIRRFEQEKSTFMTPNYEFTENGRNVRQWSDIPTRDSPDSLKYYVEEISRKWSPFVVRKKYDYKGRLRRWSTTFRQESINNDYEYDESGNVVKTTDYEERYKHSFADIRAFLLKERGIDIYDTRQAIARRYNHYSRINPEATYQIYVIKGLKDVSEGYYLFINDMTLAMEEKR